MRLAWLTIIGWLMIVNVAQGAAGITLTANGHTIEEASEFATIIDGRVYLPIRSTAEALGADVTWNGEARTAQVTYGEQTVTLLIDSNLAYVNGDLIPLESPAFIEQGRTFVPLRFVSESLSWDIEWIAQERAVVIYTADVPLKIREQLTNLSLTVNRLEAQTALATTEANNAVIPYTDEDFYWLARLIQAEASGEPLEGKIAVGACIVNRVKSDLFPNTVKDVIFHKDSGGYVQYTPVKTGYINKVTPSDNAIEAAKRALQGEDPTEGSIYFYNPKTSTSEWIFTRPVVTTIGNHTFAK